MRGFMTVCGALSLFLGLLNFVIGAATLNPAGIGLGVLCTLLGWRMIGDYA